MTRRIEAGSPDPMGVTPLDGGVNVAVYSAQCDVDRILPVRCTGRTRNGTHRASGANRRHLPCVHRRCPAGRPLRFARARPLRSRQWTSLQPGEVADRPVRARARSQDRVPSLHARRQPCAGRRRQRGARRQGDRHFTIAAVHVEARTRAVARHDRLRAARARIHEAASWRFRSRSAAPAPASRTPRPLRTSLVSGSRRSS